MRFPEIEQFLFKAARGAAMRRTGKFLISDLEHLLISEISSSIIGSLEFRADLR